MHRYEQIAELAATFNATAKIGTSYFRTSVPAPRQLVRGTIFSFDNFKWVSEVTSASCRAFSDNYTLAVPNTTWGTVSLDTPKQEGRAKYCLGVVEF